MKWAAVFQQVAARPDAIAEIAAQNGIPPTEILKQVELQTTCVGSNYDLARKAKDALSRQSGKAPEAGKEERSDEAKKLAKEAQDKLEEEAKKAWEKQQERERQKREQAQRAQQASTQKTGQQVSTPGSQGSGQGVSPSAPKGAKAGGGCSRTFKVVLGAAVALGVCLALLYVFKAAGPFIDQLTSGEPIIVPSGDQDTGGGPTAVPTCPPLVTERRKCPWSPDGYAVEPCGPGFCYDAGPQGALSCKQEAGVENSGRDYYSNLVCNEGYVAERDPCTGVILRCVKQ
jgi:hypothetical protein